MRGRPSLHIVLAAYFAILHGTGTPSSSRANFCRKPHCAALQELSTPWSAVALPSPALSVRVCLDPAGSRCYRPSNLGTARGKTAFHGRSICTAVCVVQGALPIISRKVTERLVTLCTGGETCCDDKSDASEAGVLPQLMSDFTIIWIFHST